MAIDTSVQGFTGFYEPPPQEAPVSTRDFLRGFLRGAQAGAASREFKKAKEELEAINRSREEGGFEALGPQGRTAFENRTGFSPDILENRKPPGALQGILGAALGPDLQAQQGQLNQLAIAREQRQSQLASRQFAAQDAYRNAVERDLAQAEAEAQAHGGMLDDETKVRIAAKHYLRYGATMGPGFGGALGGMISTGQRADAAELRAKSAEEALAQRAKIAAEAEAGRDYRAELAADTRLQIEETRQALANDPNNMANQIKLSNLMARWEQLALGRGNLAQREAGTALRTNAAVQSAVNTEARLAESGLAPAVPLAPPGTLPPGAGGAQPATGLVVPATRPLTAANATRNQEALSNGLNALQQIKAVKPHITSETIGPLAKVKRIVIDRGLANLYPELASEERASVDQILISLQASVTRMLKSDGNIAEPERENLMKQVPTGDEILQSPINAYNQLQSLARDSVRRALRAAANLRQPLPDEIVPDVPSDQLELLLKSGSLTPTQARRWYELNRKQ